MATIAVYGRDGCDHHILGHMVYPDRQIGHAPGALEKSLGAAICNH